MTQPIDADDTPALRHGVFLAPYHDPKGNPTLFLRRDIELAAVLEDLGYNEYWIGEHHSGGQEMIASPELIIAAAAERTSQIKLGTGVISLPYHSPLMVANRVAQLDHMTKGRVMFGFGPGLLIEDAHMMGLDPNSTRGRMLESLEVIMRLLDGETVTIDTDWFSLKDASCQILPYSHPRPEIAVASSATPSGGRAAGKYGLSMLCVAATAVGGFDVLAQNWEIAQEMATRHDQKVTRSGLRLMGPMHIAETREEARENVRHGIDLWTRYYECVAPVPFDTKGGDIVDVLIDSGRAVIGTPDDAIEMIERLQKKQGAFGAFLLQHHDWATWPKTKRSYELYAEYVMPHFAGANRNRIASWDRLQDRSAQYQKERATAAEKMHELHKADVASRDKS